MDKTATFIVKSGQCSWGKCIYCGYGKIVGLDANINKINSDIDYFFEKNKDITTLKIFGSGSFVDEKQFPKESQKYLVDKCLKNNIKNLFFESRPEFITEKNLKIFKNLNFTVAIGLEIADNTILEKLNKGFKIEDYIKATEIIKKSGGNSRTYLLVNPPYINNVESELNKSVEFVLKHSDTIVLINLYPHANADMLNLYLDLKWKPLNKTEFDKVTKKWKDTNNIEFDFETFIFSPRIPEHLRADLYGVGEKCLMHPHYEIWQDYFNRFYNIPTIKEFILFLPCAFRKPYSNSKTHKDILKQLIRLPQYPKIHQVMVSSPGVIPREFENKYPFKSYDWPEWQETADIKKQYIEITAKRIEEYLKTHKDTYKKVFVYLKPTSESYKAVEIACSNLKIRLISCIDKNTYQKILDKGKEKQILTDRLALDSLLKTLKKEAK
ncbi:MAG: DUF5591 domain-containing protein [DPANN group archaeon]|nr:DUF5591 domain-containing protein [DPANN group archaeon]